MNDCKIRKEIDRIRFECFGKNSERYAMYRVLRFLVERNIKYRKVGFNVGDGEQIVIFVAGIFYPFVKVPK